MQPQSELAQPTMSASEFEAAEARIQAALVDCFGVIGIEMARIRDTRAYHHAGYTEFDAYCRARWRWSESYVTRQIQAAHVMAALPIGNGPSNEAQARELMPLMRADPELLLETWTEVLETAPNGQPTAAHVAAVVERKLAKPVPEPESREPRPVPLLRFMQADLPTATIVTRILRVFFPDAHTALDPTYGSGAFWDGSAHVTVTAHDIDPERAPNGAQDCTALHYGSGAFDVVLFDPPHLANTGADSIMGARYGGLAIHELRRVINQGTAEAWRVCRLGIVVKVTDHVHDERYQVESDWVREALSWREPYDVVNQIRSRPMSEPGDMPYSAYGNGSTYLVMRKGDQRHVQR